MKIHIIEDVKEALQIIIKCPKADEEIQRLKEHIELFDSRLQAKRDNELCFVDVSQVLYFESVDNRTFLYTDKEVMEVKQRLYELEIILSKMDFIRISKSQIININKIKALMPELNRTMLATMCNGEMLCISRRYVQDIKKLLEI